MKLVDLQATRGQARTFRPAIHLFHRDSSGSRAAASAPNAVSVLERTIAAALLLVAAPVIAVLAIWVAMTDGAPALYRGRRLGLHRRIFQMYKVRTLRRGADQWTASRLLRATDHLEIPGGRFIRDGRLDELPQLWNIVRGEMSFVGPRPERPEVDRVQRRLLPRYTRRFAMPPGMVGPSQLFTPHSTPKRIRAWLDNCWALKPRSAGAFAGLLLYTVAAVAARVVVRGRECLVEWIRCRLVRRRRDERRLRRVSPRTALARVQPEGCGDAEIVTPVLNMNETTLLLHAAPGLPEGTRVRMRIEVALRGRRGSEPLRWAVCNAIVARQRCGSILLDYVPSTPRSYYVLHQYFLGESLAPRRIARKSRLPIVAAARSTTAAPVARSPLASVAE